MQTLGVRIWHARVLTMFFSTVAFALSTMAQITPSKNDNISVGPATFGYKLVLSTTNRTFDVGKLVLMTVTLQNVATNVQEINSVEIYGLYHKVAIVGPNGKIIPPTQWGEGMLKSEGVIRHGRHKLKPGESHSIKMPLNLLFQMSSPGEYTVRLSRRVFEHDNRSKKSWVTSEPLKIVLVEPTPEESQP